MPRKCINKPDSFCYICGEYTLPSEKRTITSNISNIYHRYFGCHVGDQDKPWAPHICCLSCAANLSAWSNGKLRKMPFAIPMIWREQINHLDDCYFCVTNIKGYSKRNKGNVKYPHLKSAIRPVKHSEEYPMLPLNCSNTEVLATNENASDDMKNNDSNYVPNLTGGPQLVTQSMLNDLRRDLKLSKTDAEILGSRLKQWSLLAPDTTVTLFRSQNKFQSFYEQSDQISFCSNITGLFNEFKHAYRPKDWLLFIDGSNSSLKAVLLHHENLYRSIPVAYAPKTKETYEVFKKLLCCLRYNENDWKICADLKVIAILTGLQLGYTNHCCFLCEWDSGDRKSHYTRKDWPMRHNYMMGQKNVKEISLVNPKNVCLPSLHIKLGLFKNFAKAVNCNSECFNYFKCKFPELSDAKVKEGIFIGPQIRYVMNDLHFDSLLNINELSAWHSVIDVVKNLLGTRVFGNSTEKVDMMLDSFNNIGCNMSLKVHLLHSHLDYFLQNKATVTDEHGKRFHQEISIFEKRYKGKCIPSMLADYCWNLVRETTGNKRHTTGRSSFYNLY